VKCSSVQLNATKERKKNETSSRSNKISIIRQKVLKNQLGNVNGIEEVGGSIPPGSTNKINGLMIFLIYQNGSIARLA
jgi:hypothetical protein